MAETQSMQPARDADPPPQDAERRQPERARPDDTQPARRVDADRVPNLDVTTDPRWALAFLAKLYTKAKERKVLNTLPDWIEPDSRSLSTVVNPARNAGFANRVARDSVLKVLVKELVDSRQLPANTPQGVDDLRKLFQRETILGTSFLETTASTWMKKTLGASRTKVLQIFADANSRRSAVTAAARLVVEKVGTTYAPIRKVEEYSIVNPKHRRYWRDGPMEDRLLHLRYIAATRRCAKEVLEKQERIIETNVDLGQEVRGLMRFPPERIPSRERERREDRSVREMVDALKVIDTLGWHPNAVRMIKAWKNGPDDGVRSLASVVNDSVNAIDKLTTRLAGDSAIVWNFPAALRGGIAGLNVIEQDPLTQYALVWASAVKPPLDTALEVLGDLISVLELFGGPLAPVAAIADAIVQAVSTAVSILKELDQDHAETATEFEKESDRLSTGGKFFDPVVQGAGALLAAKAVPGELRKLKPGKAAKGTAAIAPSPSRPATNPDPGALGTKQTRPGAGNSVTDPVKGPLGESQIKRPASGEIPKPKPESTGIQQRPSGTSEDTVSLAGKRNGGLGSPDEQATGRNGAGGSRTGSNATGSPATDGRTTAGARTLPATTEERGEAIAEEFERWQRQYENQDPMKSRAGANLSTREPWYPPPGAARKPGPKADLDTRRTWLRRRFEYHREGALKRFDEEGYTDNQLINLRGTPGRGMGDANRGTMIDGFAKETIARDIDLAEVITAPNFIDEPDLLDSVLPDWFDLTTRNAWRRHIREYGPRYGAGWGNLLDTTRR